MISTLITVRVIGTSSSATPLLTTTSVATAMAWHASNRVLGGDVFTYATINGEFSEALSDGIDLGTATQPIPCMCEHAIHCESPLSGHPYTEAIAGSSEALYVGAICDGCATTCMAGFLMTGDATEDAATETLAHVVMHATRPSTTPTPIALPATPSYGDIAMSVTTLVYGPLTVAETEFVTVAGKNGPEFLALAYHLIRGARSGQITPYSVI